MAKPKTRVKIPRTASPGEVIAIRTLISHPMNSGLRKDAGGKIIPRMIVNRFVCTFNGAVVFEAALGTAVSANPFFEFKAKVSESGVFKFAWTDDSGTVVTHEESIDVA